MYDYCVIGGGIVGVATAYRILQRHPGVSLVLLEKADALGTHQTGHNSGVIHSGIYYPPGSLKATLCRRGARATKEFAAAHGIAFEECGKLLVATDAAEHARMLALHERSTVNGVDVELVDAAELARREPRISGVGALFVPDTGIVDYRRITAAMADEVRAAGGEIVLGAQIDAVTETDSGVTATGPAGSWTARALVACAGLQADRVARLAGLRIDTRIVPFRGEYYQLPASRAGLVRTLIYPIPDPDLPFLGVHLSPTIDGDLTVGPNAVLGLAREGYRKGSLDLRDAREILGYPGFHRVAKANVRTGLRELRNSLFKRGYLAECRRYCPELTLDDLRPREAGIRAQAVAHDGTLIHDFLVERTPRMVHVLNAPSPAATSALPIADHIVDLLQVPGDQATSR
ncbi:L-2-hydroxyglutarate oxidase [Nocardia cyriacigeorgica]|uniref:L-2-hydroxyglutarate oxidase n=1 Tax=Nocardia cyriacigeorgica TaxID=135487 RepID=A0ABX0CIH8_9NOCA|nr:L-2-hydroxyglutarate oxidase [Nocardia cyriacigeorgica]NEW49455.1 L-2-hydroxyglutarate oxidase [Nocardia cyriacigeorgica]NEW54141.1 L-2-hydroxyglutarate oxidase [Nocardia cyriacigeorgica]